MREQCYMGLDLSYTSTGLVLLDRFDEVVLSKSIKSTRKGVARLMDLRDAIHEIMAAHNVVHIAQEGYAMGAKWGREQAGELGGVVKLMLYEHYGFTPGKNLTLVAPTSVKKFATNDGRAKKEDIKLAVSERWGQSYRGKSNDEADAFVLAKISRAIGGELLVDLTEFQKKVLKAIHKDAEGEVKE